MSSSLYFCLLLFMSFFHLSLAAQNSSNVLCKDVERQALLEFKHGLVDHADRLASWVGDDKECCSWAGIVCDNFTGHVHRLHLRGGVNGDCRVHYYTTVKEYNEISKQTLGGDLSPSLLHLEQLMHLDLSCNDFGGIQVPSFIGSLGNLRYLNLSRSRFGGIIPPQLGNLSELQVLSLGSDSTHTVNMRWLSSLHLLHHLDMSNMDLSNAVDWFQVMNTVPSLVKLRLSFCELSHIHPHVPALNLTFLSSLDLSGNYFDNSSVPQWIFSITSLVSLDLSGCNFQGIVPGNFNVFRNLTSLKFLHVSRNDFMNSTLVLKGLSSIGSTLISLDISSCSVSSSGLDVIQNLTSLLSVDLSYNQITKGIPKSFGNLCNLRHIDMTDNKFENISLTFFLESFLECKSPSLESLFLEASGLSGHLPDQLGQLIHLVHLNLGENKIVGIIPNSLGQLSFMRSLQLNVNLVSGPIPYSIGGLSLLDMLDLSQNRLNGSLPHSLGQLSNLNHLDFSFNLLSGVVTEAHFVKLTGLTYLNGMSNNLTLRPQHANWTPPFKLQFLDLNSWGLGPLFPLWLQSQRDLMYLDISNTNISAPLPKSFWRTFPNLTDLYMSQNHIQGTLFGIPATLGALDLSSNEFTGQLPSLSNGSGTLFLDLSNNSFVGSLHHLLCPSDEKSTEVLKLGDNYLSGVIPECWVKWQGLEILNLENNNLSGEIPRTLGFSFLIYSLNMRGNKLSGSLPTSLMNLTGLLFLQLGRNELVGSIPSWLGTKLSSLISLDLRSNNFDGNIPQEFWYLTGIHILDLAHNNLTGTIPGCFNNFSALSQKESYPIQDYYTMFVISESVVVKGREDIYNTILLLVKMMDLSGNNLVGHIPSELTTLQELRSLNLSRNQLTGRIPEKIGDMKSLEAFDLSLNKLSGELPMSLSSLSFLSNFNVSNNNFTGRIPSSTQLHTFGESSFFGNNLCGDPLTKPCVVTVPYKDQEENDGPHGADWGLIISVVFGFVAGFWIIVCPLIVSRSWRIAYFGLLTMVHDVIQKYCCKMFPK